MTCPGHLSLTFSPSKPTVSMCALSGSNGPRKFVNKSEGSVSKSRHPGPGSCGEQWTWKKGDTFPHLCFHVMCALGLGRHRAKDPILMAGWSVRLWGYQSPKVNELACPLLLLFTRPLGISATQDQGDPYGSPCQDGTPHKRRDDTWATTRPGHSMHAGIKDITYTTQE
jgi:hypothetical protein